MGNDQSNQRSLSWLKLTTYEACERRYFLKYELTDYPDRERFFEVKAQRKLIFWNAMAGQVTDDVIKSVVRDWK